MLVKEYREKIVAGEVVYESRVKDALAALSLWWVVRLGGTEIWEPDEQGYGLVMSSDGRCVAVILKETGE